MSGLYNVVFGDRTEAGLLVLATIGGFTYLDDVGRYRDAWVEKVDGGLRFAVYTRNGGGNRTCVMHEGATSDCGAAHCYGCIQTHRLPAHPLYLHDADDAYDATYATTYFRLPPDLPDDVREALLAAAVPPVDTAARWRTVLDALETR